VLFERHPLYLRITGLDSLPVDLLLSIMGRVSPVPSLEALPFFSSTGYGLPIYEKPKVRVRALLGHCLYRRVILWGTTAVFLILLALFTSGERTRHGKLLDLVDFRGNGRVHELPMPVVEPTLPTTVETPTTTTYQPTTEAEQPQAKDDEEQQATTSEEDEQEKSNMPHWLKYPQYESSDQGRPELRS
jgi:hypothetical protein